MLTGKSTKNPLHIHAGAFKHSKIKTMAKKKPTEGPIEGQYEVSTDEYDIPKPLSVEGSPNIYEIVHLHFRGKKLTPREAQLHKQVLLIPKMGINPLKTTQNVSKKQSKTDND